MSLRTYPIAVSAPRREPTLLGFIRRAEAELQQGAPRPRPRPVPPLRVGQHA
jgi:hypothetical protein